jgi:hypothetical protein
MIARLCAILSVVHPVSSVVKVETATEFERGRHIAAGSDNVMQYVCKLRTCITGFDMYVVRFKF